MQFYDLDLRLYFLKKNYLLYLHILLDKMQCAAV